MIMSLPFILSFSLSQRNQSFILQIMITVRRLFVRDTKSNDIIKILPSLTLAAFYSPYITKRPIFIYTFHASSTNVRSDQFTRADIVNRWTAFKWPSNVSRLLIDVVKETVQGRSRFHELKTIRLTTNARKIDELKATTSIQHDSSSDSQMKNLDSQPQVS